MQPHLPPSWQAVLADEFTKPYFKDLQEFVADERKKHTVYPPEEDVFNAFKYTPYDKAKVLLLGQDPYHGEGQAHGLCFSVRPGVKPPPSLMNMFKELHHDLGCKVPNNGCLIPWAKQGVMLLNAVLTVRAHEAELAQGQGLGDVHRRRDPGAGGAGDADGVPAVGRLRAEEEKADRRGAGRDPDGGAPVAAVGVEVLRQPAVLGGQQGAGGAGRGAD